jgi:serine protease Do
LLSLFIFERSIFAKDSDTGLVEHVKRAVVMITTYDKEGSQLLQGSGFFISPNQIVTNMHVLNDAYKATIKTFDGRSYQVQGMLAMDKKGDLAIIQVETIRSKIRILSLEKSVPTKEESVIVVSNPIGSPWNVTKGKTVKVWNFVDLGNLIQMTASIARGSSGGPVVNRYGLVVGVATLHLKSAEELNFAIPVNHINRLSIGPLAPLSGETNNSNDTLHVAGKAESKR